MLRDPLTKSRLWPVVLAAIVLTACAGRAPLGAGMQGAAAQLGGPAAQPRAWSEAMEQRRARLSDVLSSAGVEVQRTPDNVLLLRWPADRAFAANSANLSAAADADWGPIRHNGKLQDRAAYRYYWTLLKRARSTGVPLPAGIAERFFTA